VPDRCPVARFPVRRPGPVEEVIDCWCRVAHVFVKPYRRKHVWSAADLVPSLPQYACGLLCVFELFEEKVLVFRPVVTDLAIDQGGSARVLSDVMFRSARCIGQDRNLSPGIHCGRGIESLDKQIAPAFLVIYYRKSFDDFWFVARLDERLSRAPCDMFKLANHDSFEGDDLDSEKARRTILYSLFRLTDRAEHVWFSHRRGERIDRRICAYNRTESHSLAFRELRRRDDGGP